MEFHDKKANEQGCTLEAYVANLLSELEETAIEEARKNMGYFIDFGTLPKKE